MSNPEERKKEIENALMNQLQNIDKLYLRKLQKAAYECSAKCCDSPETSMEGVQSCINKCNGKLHESQRFFASEVENYQIRLQRCVSQCNDEARDHMGASPTEAEVKKASNLFENCACKCIDKHIVLLPQFMAKVHEVLKKNVISATNMEI